MTNLIYITDLTDADLDALLGLDAEAAAEAAKVAADRRALDARPPHLRHDPHRGPRLHRRRGRLLRRDGQQLAPPTRPTGHRRTL